MLEGIIHDIGDNSFFEACNNPGVKRRMSMDTLQNMRVFVRVVEAGSFTGAARRLNSTTACASRAVSDLEAHLRTRLLNRTTRRMALTEAGKRYLNSCEQILAYVDQAEVEATDTLPHPSGKLKVHAITGFGQHYVVPAVGAFRRRYPDVSVELTLTQQTPDLLEEGYDVALVLATAQPASGYVSQHLASTFSIACASPRYLEQRGVPRTPADLAAHTCLQLVTPEAPPAQWRFSGPRGEETINLKQTTFRVNVAEALAVALREGMGVGLLPIYTAMRGLRSGELAWILPDYTSRALGVYAIHPSRSYPDAKVRLWVEMLREQLPSTLMQNESELRQFSRH